MSKDKIKKFFEELEKDSGLREKFISSMGDEMSQAAIISFAGSNGFNFSENELQEYCTELSDNMNCNHELEDESLAQAAGGLSTQRAVLFSVISVGWGCLAASILYGKECAQYLSTSGRRGECHD